MQWSTFKCQPWYSPNTVAHSISLIRNHVADLESIFIWKTHQPDFDPEWSYPLHLQNIVKCDDIIRRGGNRRPVWQWKGGRPLSPCPRVSGTPATVNTSPTYNSTSSGILNETIRQKRSKSIDMCFYWIKYHVNKGQFLVFYHSVLTNLSLSYQTPPGIPSLQNAVHLPPTERPRLQSNFYQPDHLLGCVNTYPWSQVPKGNLKTKFNPDTGIQYYCFM